MKALQKFVARAICFLVRLFYKKPEFVGLEALPEGPCVIVGNHAQMNGPIIAELYIPGDREIWCAGEMMHFREVPDYAYRDFWSKKPTSVRWFYRLLSYVIAPISVSLFNNVHCIAVYHDARMLSTLRETVQRLSEGARIVIFPEHEVPHNEILWDFQEGFVDVARLYQRRTGQSLSFVPMYVAPALHRVVFGTPIAFDSAADPRQERRRVGDALMDAVTGLAVAQPRHRVVPYPNMPKKDYPWNRPEEDCEK